MEEESRKMCQACGSKEATHHICQPGAEPRNISLCGECMKTDAPSALKVYMEKLKNAVCQYCGGSARSSAIFPVGGLKVQTGRFVCQSCSTESQRVFFATLNDRGMTLQDFSDLGDVKKCQRILEDLDTHMSRWVIQRDN